MIETRPRTPSSFSWSWINERRDSAPVVLPCCIGNARTPLASRMADGVPQANGEIKPEPLMDVDHVGAAVLHMANLPLETNVQFMTIMATKMPFIGRG